MIQLLYLGGDNISRLSLKIIALLTMILDHISILFFPEATILRLIGRMAFPLYCFLIVDGYFHVKDDKKRLCKYILNILLFAIITEVPFNLLFYNRYFYFLQQNVLFDLFLGLIMLILLDQVKNNKALKIFYFLMTAFLSTIFFANYIFHGVILFYGFYLYKKSLKNNTLYTAIIAFATSQLLTSIVLKCFIDNKPFFNVLMNNYILAGTFITIPLILNYNGLQGKYNKAIKYLFYLSYPLHIVLFLLIKYYVL